MRFAMSESRLVVGTYERLFLDDIVCDEGLLTARTSRLSPPAFGQ